MPRIVVPLLKWLLFLSNHNHILPLTVEFINSSYVTMQGMNAGENTLNALCARVVMRGIAANRG